MLRVCSLTIFVLVLVGGCSPARISAPDDKPPLLAVVPASPATMTTLGVSAWKLYEGSDRRVADGVTGADDVRVELDSSPQGFVFVDTAGNRITIDGRGTSTLWTAAQQAGALLDADVRNQSDGNATLLVCDAEAAALADTIQRAAMICQANPGSQACRDALHDIHQALHVLLDCILPPFSHHDGGVRDAGDFGDGGIESDGGVACGGMDPHMAIFTGCSSQSWGRDAGDRCWRALDCKAVCCNCTGQSWSAAACIGGHCAGQADACTCLHDLAPQLCQ